MNLHRRINITAYVASVGKARLRRRLKEGAVRHKEEGDELRAGVVGFVDRLLRHPGA